jgi:hypothetical protein
MNCFYHPQMVAIAICKNCNRGLCADCGSDVGNGIACKNKCEEEVRAFNEMIDRNKSSYRKTGNFLIAIAMFFISCGLLGLVAMFRWRELPFLILGSFLLISGIVMFLFGKKFKRRN